ncbi:iron uptake protein [Hyphomonas adhaerens MHS-3]|uniref:Iron uptake protein n=1 Tax=Hyphomonas adhaerens MHS-3 TaxID=1280949 RepID=A0A069E808_9PROT|nr:PepSY-associated TM helix domain-containing protein [Hyphomonas adhaerens]KCZ86119.1 iron uptake protein [Hyphomonas adhaerens MHS-3]
MASGAGKPIWPRVPPGFVKGQLLAHKLLGLTLSAVMYLVCLTGAVAVFYAEFERWEAPGVPEMAEVSPEAVGRAVAFARQHISEAGDTPVDVYVITPSPEMPRLIIDYEEDVLAFDQNGDYVGPGAHELTHFLTELHYALHLPWQIGFIVVGILGVLLVALIVGGALALPRMFRDAFTLRLGSGRRLARVDIHNRLAVWGLPFHLVVAVSGAVMGLAMVAISVASPVMFSGDSGRAMAALYGDTAALSAQAREAGPPSRSEPEARIVAALKNLAIERPGNPPIYLALNQFSTPDEMLSIAAGHPDRLIYSEVYRFDSAGGLMSSDGYADGNASQQVLGSMFRIHAGAFGGILVKLIYFALGLGLSFICTTGVDIWLAKAAARGRQHPGIQSTWTSFVWGTPAMLAIAGALYILWAVPPEPVFWIGLIFISLGGIWVPQRLLHWIGPAATATATLLLLTVHAVRFGPDVATHAGLGVSAGLFATSFALAALGWRNWTKAGTVQTGLSGEPGFR